MRNGTHITKRGQIYYFRRIIKGKLVCQSLGVGDKRLAEAKARQISAALDGNEWDKVFAVRQELPSCGPTIGLLTAHYETHCAELGLKPEVARHNLMALLWVMRKAGLENPLALPVSVLTGRLVREMKAGVLREIAVRGESPDRARQVKFSANCFLRQARGLFKPAALRFFEDAGMKVTLDPEFRAEPNFPGVSKSNYQPPSDDIVARTFRTVELLATRGGLDNRNMFKLIVLATGAGLRMSEALAARWGWFVQIDGKAYLRTNQVTKNGDLLQLPMLPGWYEKLLAVKPAEATDDTLVIDAPVKTQRVRTPADRVGKLMKALGWRTQKKTHAFRALAGCRVAEACGIEAASIFLRHGSIGVTQKHYGHFLKLRSLDGVKII